MRSHGCVADGVPTTVADRYDLVACLGVGGMGVVHSVRDRRTGQLFAIKQAAPERWGAAEPQTSPRTCLEREYRVLSRLRHVNVVRAYDFHSDGPGEPFLVLELLEHGWTIDCYGLGAASAERVRVLVEMFEGLAYVHRKGFVHRDIKPSNILVCHRPATGEPFRPGADELPTPGPRVCLIDFGLTVGTDEKTTPAGDDGCGPPSLLGSRLYLAPELFDGENASFASDLYGAGMVAAEVLTGADPVFATGPRPTLASLLQFPRSWVEACRGNGALDKRSAALLLRLLAPDPGDRPSRAEEVVCELEAIGRWRGCE